MPRPRYQPSQRASLKRQYQQNATCNLYTDNLLQSERQSKPHVSRPLRGLSRLGFWARGRQTLPSSKFLMRGPLVRRACFWEVSNYRDGFWLDLNSQELNAHFFQSLSFLFDVRVVVNTLQGFAESSENVLQLS
jgi:hypothetical protein